MYTNLLKYKNYILLKQKYVYQIEHQKVIELFIQRQTQIWTLQRIGLIIYNKEQIETSQLWFLERLHPIFGSHFSMSLQSQGLLQPKP